MKSLIYSTEALKDLKRIYDYVADNFSEEIARNAIHSIFKNIHALQSFPMLGKTSEISPILRELIVENNTVFYQIGEKTIDVVYIKARGTTK